MSELHLAAYHGELDWVRGCIEGGLDTEARDKSGWTPLFWAVDMAMVGAQSEEVVRLLLASGADVHARDNAGESVVARAVMAGDHCVVEILLEAGADVNVRDTDGRTLLQIARADGHREMAHVLVAALRRAKS